MFNAVACEIDAWSAGRRGEAWVKIAIKGGVAGSD